MDFADLVLSSESLTLDAPGKTAQLTASIEPETLDSSLIKWTTEDKSIAMVDSEGFVVRVAPGTTTVNAVVTVLGEERSYPCRVTVKNANLTGIDIPDSLEVPVKSSSKLAVEFTPSDTSQTGITWKSADTTVATVDQKGNVKGVQRGTTTITAVSKSNSRIKAICKVTVLFTDATRENVSSEMFKAIYWAADKKITGEKERFGTNNTMTRAQFVRFLYRYVGEPKVTKAMTEKYGSQFKDVNKNYTHYKAIVWAVSKGLIAGYSDGTFKPEKTLTRNNVATILWKFAGEPKVSNVKKPFADVAKSAALAWGKSKKIFTGTKFQPKANCLRGDFAVFLYRYNKNVK